MRRNNKTMLANLIHGGYSEEAFASSATRVSGNTKLFGKDSTSRNSLIKRILFGQKERYLKVDSGWNNRIDNLNEALFSLESKIEKTKYGLPKEHTVKLHQYEYALLEDHKTKKIKSDMVKFIDGVYSDLLREVNKSPIIEVMRVMVKTSDLMVYDEKSNIQQIYDAVKNNKAFQIDSITKLIISASGTPLVEINELEADKIAGANITPLKGIHKKAVYLTNKNELFGNLRFIVLLTANKDNIFNGFTSLILHDVNLKNNDPYVDVEALDIAAIMRIITELKKLDNVTNKTSKACRKFYTDVEDIMSNGYSGDEHGVGTYLYAEEEHLNDKEYYKIEGILEDLQEIHYAMFEGQYYDDNSCEPLCSLEDKAISISVALYNYVLLSLNNLKVL